MSNNGGFTLGGKTARQLGMRMLRTSQRPILPGTVDRTLAIAGRNGMYDFGADLGARQFYMDCAILRTSPAALQQASSELATHLVDAYGKPRTLELIFDLQPDRKYYVRFSGGGLNIERIVGLGRFTIPFIAFDPRAHSITDSEDIILDSDFFLDSEIRLDDTWEFTVRGPGQYEINNWGSQMNFPEIIVTGIFTALSITANGKTFGYNTAISSQTLVIDGERKTVRVGNTNMLANMTGDFVELLPGINNITIGGAGLYCSVSFIYRPTYI